MKTTVAREVVGRGPRFAMPIGAQATRTLWLYGVVGAVRALGLVLVAESLASGIGLLAYTQAALHPGAEGLFAEPRHLPLLGSSWLISHDQLSAISNKGLAASDFTSVLVVMAVGALLQAGAQWVGTVLARRAALGAQAAVRDGALRRVFALGGRDTPEGLGATSLLLTRELDDLDPYYTQTLTSLVFSAVVPLLVGLRILAADPWSALVVVLTVPLVPVFMVLVGTYTRDSTAEAQSALHQLSHHLAELAQGLPVLVGLGRAGPMRQQIRELSNMVEARSMQTLRIAFLSSLALDLISTLSVAVVAVTVGVRLLGGNLALDAGLIALILAPECYLPLRNVGMAFHASANGLEAVRRVNRIIDQPVPQPMLDSASNYHGACINDLTVRYPGQLKPALNHFSCRFQAGDISVVTGASGSGKTTLLGVLNGYVRDGLVATGTEHPVSVSGRVTGVNPDRVVWVPQDIHTVNASVADELIFYGAENIDAAREFLALCNAQHLIFRDPASLSLGELRRVGVARAVARLAKLAASDGYDGALVLMDEPTAHVDDYSAQCIRNLVASIHTLYSTASVVVVTHDPAMADFAHHRIELKDGRKFAEGLEADARPAASVSCERPYGEPSSVVADQDHAPADDTINGSVTQPRSAENDAAALPVGQVLRVLGHVVQPSKMRWWAALALGVLGAGFAVSLSGLSGWLIVEASAQPPILLLMVAIVGVRFFGLGRSALRYLERLTTHRAVFVAATDLRLLLWNKLSYLALTRPNFRSSGQVLQRLIGDVDDARDLAPRIFVPAFVGVILHVAVIGLVAWLLPQALWVQVTLAVLTLLCAPLLALLTDSRQAVLESRVKSRILHKLSQAIAAAGDLRANRAEGKVREDLVREDAQATRMAQRSAVAQGLGEALAVAAGICAAGATLWVSIAGVNADAVSSGTVAAIALADIALLVPAVEVITAVRKWPQLRAILERIGVVLFSPSPAESWRGDDKSHPRNGAADNQPVCMTLHDVSVQWPTSPQPVLQHLSARVCTGQWLSVLGPSGSGKSTFLAVLMGILQPCAGSIERSGLPAAESESGLQGFYAWCPQDAHLFDSTVAANVSLGRPIDQPPTTAELEGVMAAVGLEGWVNQLAQGLDTRVGSNGEFVSGGQRQRIAVARALLTRAPVLLLDEPTAHLDRETAASLIRDMRRSTPDRAVVLVTHRSEDTDPADQLLILD